MRGRGTVRFALALLREVVLPPLTCLEVINTSAAGAVLVIDIRINVYVNVIDVVISFA